MIKKYFILLVIILPLTQIGSPLVMVLDPKVFLSSIMSSGDPTNAYRHIVEVAGLISFYLFTTLLGIILFIDLKKNWKLIGIPLLTIMNPVFGVTLFIVRNYYVNKNSGNNG